MKRNLLQVLILAIVIVNMVLTAVMMFSVTGTNQKTAQLVSNIAATLNLEITAPGGAVPVTEVSMADTTEYSLGSMTIPLTRESVTVNSENGPVTETSTKQTYIVITVALVMNTTNEDYATYGTAEALAERTEIIKDTISEVVGSHTESECRDNFEQIRAELLLALQDLFRSEFIYRIAISDIKYG